MGPHTKELCAALEATEKQAGDENPETNEDGKEGKCRNHLTANQKIKKSKCDESQS